MRSVLFALMAAVMIIPAAVLLTVPAAAEPVDDVTIHGISERSGSMLKIAVTGGVSMAYPDITWYVYLPAAAHVSHTINGNATIDADLDAGLHSYDLSYDVGTAAIVWSVDGIEYTFTLRITTTSAIIPEEVDDGKIRIDPSFLAELERDVAIGCIVAALIPSIFIVPFWKARKDEKWEDAHD